MIQKDHAENNANAYIQAYIKTCLCSDRAECLKALALLKNVVVIYENSFKKIGLEVAAPKEQLN